MTHNRLFTETGQAVPTAVQPEEGRITLALQLSASLKHLEKHITLLPEPYPCCMLFFTLAAEGKEACVFIVRRATLEAAWREGATRVRQWAWVRKLNAVDLRIDWLHEITELGNRIPLLRQLGSASAWALADHDLEYAELLPPMELSNIGQTILDTRLKTCASTHDTPAGAPANLLLRLQGLHIDRNGVQTALPQTQNPQYLPPRPIEPWRPFTPALHMLCQQQQREGNWLNVVGCDHLGMMYALLLAQRHVVKTTLTHAMLVQAIDHAMAYLQKSIATLLLRTHAAHIEQAMCLLIFTRYLSSRNGCGAFPDLIDHMERLAKKLRSCANSASPHSKPWISLALGAFEQCKTHVNCQPIISVTFRTGPAGECTPESAFRPFCKSPTTNHQSDNDFHDDGFGNQRWQAISIAESSLLNPCHDALLDKYYMRWTLTHRHFYYRQVNGSSGPGWPSFAPTSREQAAFLALTPACDLASNCRTAAQLLLTAFATYKLFNP